MLLFYETYLHWSVDKKICFVAKIKLIHSIESRDIFILMYFMLRYSFNKMLSKCLNDHAIFMKISKNSGGGQQLNKKMLAGKELKPWCQKNFFKSLY